MQEEQLFSRGNYVAIYRSKERRVVRAAETGESTCISNSDQFVRDVPGALLNLKGIAVRLVYVARSGDLRECGAA